MPGGAEAQKDSTLKKIAQGKIKPAVLSTGGMTRTMPTVSGATVNAFLAALAASNQEEMREEEADGGTGPNAAGAFGFSRSNGCDSRNTDGNVRVNQDCTFRRQAEEMIAFDPTDPSNLVAGQNDSRVGFNQCGIDWSTDNGRNWGDLLPPFRQKLNNPASQEPTASDPNRHTILGGPGTNHTYDAGSDPMVALDSRGNAYFGCVGFDIASDASLLYATRSPKEAQGSFFFNVTSRFYVIAEDNNPEVFHDKNFIAADKYPGSPNRDNVYVTWTVFRFSAACGPQPNPDGEERFCQSPIFGSMTTDGGHHWSTPELVSGTSSVCFVGNFFQPTAPANSCNFDQGSDPTVLPNGDLVVIFNNGNTAPTNPNAQQLSVLCHPSGDSAAGTAHLNCGNATRVGDDVVAGEPQCNFGRGPEECIPGAYIRTNDFPRISRNVNNNLHLYAAWQDYRNGRFDIQLSQSLDGGRSWQEVGTVNPDRARDHYFPAIDVALSNNPGRGDDDRDDDHGRFNGDRVGVSYYRTDRVPNENTPPTAGFGCPAGTTQTAPFQCSGTGPKNSDYVLAGGRGASTPFDFKVVSPQFAPPDGIQSGFNGDYSGLVINRGSEAHPIWSDTRNTNPFPENGVVHDEDVFTTSTNLP